MSGYKGLRNFTQPQNKDCANRALEQDIYQFSSAGGLFGPLT